MMRISRMYTTLSRFAFLSYRAKIMLMAFIGTHVPLIALACYFAIQSAPNWPTLIATLGITLVATLIGTGLTLFAIHRLMQPIMLTSKALRRYREERYKIDLPVGYTDEVGVLMADADATLDYLEQARDTLEHIDEVTSLPNRKKLLQLMDRRTRLGLSFTVCVIRFANYSRIIESLDMAQANKAAEQLAARLENHAEPGGIVARIGQSDFALFRGQRRDDENEWTITVDQLHTLIDQCSAVVSLESIEIKPELLCGVAAFPSDASDAETSLDHAIAAAAQASSSSPIVFHSKQARRAAFKRLTIEQQLRRAIDNDEFFLCYQPVVDFENRRAVGAEALLRWQKPDQGLIPPGEFIPAAEASGLIAPIGRWVMHRACEQMREWQISGMGDLRMAINLSARQFLDPNLSTQIAEAIDHAGIDPSRIELELTETSATHDMAYTRQMLSKLRDLGVTVAIDDFGTGYANLSYLRQLPFDKLKIDRDFVANVHDRSDGQAICRSIIALCEGFGLDVLAEGTETEQEVRYLSREGCHLFQGYFFARPLSSSDFDRACQTLPALIAKSQRAISNEAADHLSTG